MIDTKTFLSIQTNLARLEHVSGLGSIQGAQRLHTMFGVILWRCGILYPGKLEHGILV